ncbi:uncharacterized protein LOC110280455 [Arachis duranensis]|uniref:Uncharacterized protein LOC110280455 n=1 Tax=Arachis duranensis TaxID=130453 RepID=A0A6P5NHT6_ARADU|nr:uncharacterized protein LOC110280455 [Arachis duranensis]
MAAMPNLVYTIQAGTAATIHAMGQIGQPAESENGEGTRNSLGDVLRNLAEFLKITFYNKFFHEVLREVRELELIRLKQGVMTVIEYTSKFEELSNNCRHGGNQNAGDTESDPLRRDDILVYSKTAEEHEEHMRIVLQILKEWKFYAKLLKYELRKEEVKFLGHIVSKGGIEVDPSKVKEDGNGRPNTREITNKCL